MSLEQEIKNLIGAVQENTLAIKELVAFGSEDATLVNIGEALDIPATVEKVDMVDLNTEADEAEKAEAPAKKPRKKRRSKAEIEAEKQAKLDAVSEEEGSAPPPPPSVDPQMSADTSSPKYFGRTFNGIDIPEGVALGRETDWFSFCGIPAVNDSGLIMPTEQSEAPLTIEDVRAKLIQLSPAKGGVAITKVIAKFGTNLDSVTADKYAALIAEAESLEDESLTPPPPPAA